jgi:hypothetical protein
MAFGQDKQGFEELRQKLYDHRIESEVRAASASRFYWIGTVGALVLSLGCLGYVGSFYIPEAGEETGGSMEAGDSMANKGDAKKPVKFGFEALPAGYQAMVRREAARQKKEGCKDPNAAWAAHRAKLGRATKAAKEYRETNNPLALFRMVKAARSGGTISMVCAEKLFGGNK